jgi:hypothetical protein
VVTYREIKVPGPYQLLFEPLPGRVDLSSTTNLVKSGFNFEV